MSAGDAAPEETSVDVVLDYIANQVVRLHRAERDVWTDEPDAVHKMRVAIRRLRSALAVYGRFFDPKPVKSLSAELRWLGQTLAPVRDLEVIADRLVAGAKADPEDGRAELAGYLARPMEQAQRSARDQVLEALDSPRTKALWRALDRLPSNARVAGGGEVADPGVRQLADTTWSDLRARAAHAAPGSSARGGRDAALHKLRKAAKRVRYALELTTMDDKPRRPDDQQMLEALRKLQQVLGEHHDTVATRKWLKAHPPGSSEREQRGAHARLLKHERRAAKRCELEYEPILRRIIPA
jgi:CHAD domain-containing protein